MMINRFWLAGIFVAAGLIFGIVSSIRSTAMEFVTVTALQTQTARFDGKLVKITGTIEKDTTRVGTNEAGESTLTFSMKGEQGRVCEVFFRGPRPDAFNDGGTVIIEGRYDARARRLTAETLLAKCPSRYEGQDPSKHPDGKYGPAKPTAPTPRPADARPPARS